MRLIDELLIGGLGPLILPQIRNLQSEIHITPVAFDNTVD